jgi:Na+-transporting methylmalonyl-CoA/oxaloacetate decarboxylase gamma subunit
MEIVERLLNPAIVWVFIPILAILLWGITRIIRALRGEPEDFEEWKNELKQLQARVDKLEQRQQATSPSAASAQANVPTGSYRGTQ